MTIVVFGSINMDLVARVPHLPVQGETLIGHHFDTVPGGKGANQAVAIAQLGVHTQMVGRLGTDGFSKPLLDSLQQSGVECDRVWLDPAHHSGVAIIAVDEQGENHIIVIPGANGQLDQGDVERLKPLLPEASHLMLQLEVPLDAVVAAARVAKAAGVTVVLDPAPARADLPDELLACTDILTPNQIEATQLTGHPVHDYATAEQAARQLQRRGVATVIVKLGSQGSLCVSEGKTLITPAMPVEVVDTVAAGDAFNGGLVTALEDGRSLEEALRWATAAATLCVSQHGAQSSMPDRPTLEAFLAQLPNEASIKAGLTQRH